MKRNFDKSKTINNKPYRKNMRSNGRKTPDRSDAGGYEQTEHKYNDVSWYAKNDQMLKDSASLSYNSPVGTTYPSLISGAKPDDAYTNVVPTICKLRTLMSPGKADNQSSPANLAANNIYAYVRYMNSGAKNYDQPDLMLYLLAMDSIYAQWNYMKRMYGMARFYSQYNRTVPIMLYPNDGIYKELYNNLADFRLWLNKMAAQISSFCVPAVMPLFIRHSWMFSNVYKDSDNLKAQMYMFEPAAFYHFSETGSKFGGSLEAQDASLMTTLAALKQSLESNITAISYSEDIGIMSGDILKAYGQEKLFKLAPVDEDYTVEPVYNEEVLNQIHNSRMLPISLQGSGLSAANITQDPNTGFLIWGNKFVIRNSSIPSPTSIMLNMPWDDVTPANTMVGTRLTTAYTSDDDGYLTITAMGTEAIINREYDIYSPSLNDWTAVRVDSDFVIPEATVVGVTNALTTLQLASNFDWHPLILAGVKDNTGSITEIGPVGDITNYTVVTTDQIQKIHETAVMSLFNIPQLGSF